MGLFYHTIVLNGDYNTFFSYLYQSTPNGFSGNLIPDSMSPVDNDSGAGYKKASSRP